MKNLIRQILCGLPVAMWFCLVNADSTGISGGNPAIMDKVSSLYYLTFASGSVNPNTAGSSYQTCPTGGIFVNSSVVTVTSFPGLVSGPSGVYMWQCYMMVGTWNALNSSASVIDPIGVDPALNNLSAALNLSTINWESYTHISSAQYTGYQFTNNAFVPIGIGGSGLGCGGAGGQSRVTCNAGGVTLGPSSTSGGQWLFYLQPGQSASCTLHRDYGSSSACSGSGCPCDGTYTVQAGQALVGACCNGTWKTETTNFSDPNFNTCGGGC
jgi:hypothetical protein